MSMDSGPSYGPNTEFLTKRVIGFARFLRSKGYKVFPGAAQKALQALTAVSIFHKSEFFYTLRTTMVTSDLEWQQFPDHFREYWETTPSLARSRESSSHEEGPATESLQEFEVVEVPEPATEAREGEETLEVGQWLETVGYSPFSDMEKRDLARFDKGDIGAARLALKAMVAPFKVDKTRRLKRSPAHGRVLDLGYVMRKSLKSQGLPLELFYRERRKRLKRLVVIADVSGSMERYARFVIPFLLGLRGVGSRAEVFVFSTRLTRITHLIQHLEVEKVLKRLPLEVNEWAGGTRIGFSLQQFNERYGHGLLTRRTVVVILSDGWDLGGKQILRRAMETLGSKVHSIIWLNPLLGDPDLRPLGSGMTVALPFLDYLLPAMNLQDLKRAARVISKTMVI